MGNKHYMVGIRGRLRDLRRLGLGSALKLWRRAARRGEFAINVCGYAESFHLRGASSDAWVFHSLIVSDEYTLIPAGFSPRTILDAGANIGLGSRWMKRKWPDAQIVAVEPDEDNLRLAHANLEGTDDVEVIAGALWSNPGRVGFVYPDDEKYALRVTAEGDGPICCYSVPEIMARMGWDRIDLLKLDIEGAEREVFGEGAGDWIEKIGMIVVELHEGVSPGCTVALFRALNGTSYTLKWRGENLVVIFDREAE